MNKIPPNTTADNEHGTIASYAIGFILSLLFTFVPFFMVINKTVSGTALVAAILGFAFIQMLIQIFFFLHLGRGPKPFYNIVFFFVTILAILVVVAGSVFIMSNLYSNMAPDDVAKKLIEKEGIYQIGGERTGACQGIHTNHKVIISGGAVNPMYTEARLCDTLTFINEDAQGRELAFGPHPRQDSYAGETEVILRNGRSKTITLNQAGEYIFHDFLDPSTTGRFNVTE